MRQVINVFIILLLTLLTQVGGLVYLLCLLIVRKRKKIKRLRLLVAFCALYALFTFVLVPLVAPVFGREPIQITEHVKPHSNWYVLLNRNYVKPELNRVISTIGEALDNSSEGIKLVYLDACLPFIDGFPLLPHLSHNDGKKIDIAFIYKDGSGAVTNQKRSRSGYGVYEGPRLNEYNQCEACKAKGYEQYDMPKYLTFGEMNKNEGLTLDEKISRELIQIIVSQPEIGKLFIEPHLKTRMGLTNQKIRFQGCKAARHDDHIHLQLR